MRTLAHNKIFLSAVLVLMQISFVARLSPCRVPALFGGGSCCCGEVPHQDARSESRSEGCCASQQDALGERKQSCSSSQEATPRDKGDGGRDESSSHGVSSCECVGSPDVFLAEAREKKQEKPGWNDDSVAQAPTVRLDKRALHAQFVRLKRSPVPRQRTGPPLQVLYQVFLI